MNVPWLPKKAIADCAACILDDYRQIVRCDVQPPIPIEDLIERGLNLHLGYADLRTALDMDDVLGATYIKERVICVDESLLKDKFEGRLSFTFAHETGHWVLHRQLVDHVRRSHGPKGLIFCRKKDAQKAIEWQADYFASCLLMPAESVRKAYYASYGTRPLIIYNLKSTFCGPICADPCVQNWPFIADRVKKTGGFSNVSKQAMIIRLQDLKLVKNETSARLSWEASFGMT